MSVFEPKTVLTLLKTSTAVSPLEKNTFEKKWRVSVEKRVSTWNEARSHMNNPRPQFQLQWESEIVEYVQFLWEKTRTRSKKGEPSKLGVNVPLLGPRFLPPSYLHVQKRSGGGAIEPTTQYLKPLNIVHPFYYPQLGQCPRCGSDKDTAWEGWTSKGARELHGLFCEEAALGTQLRCNRCKESSKAKTRGDTASGMVAGIEGYCFATTSAMYWKGWEHWRIPRGLPIFFYRCALTRDLFDLLIELRPSSTSAGLEERVRQLHLFEHKRRMLEYLEAVRARECQNDSKNSLGNYFNSGVTSGTCLQAFSAPDDALGYSDKSVSRDTITEIESANYLKSLSAICASLDNTFKAANKATLTNKDGQKTKEIKGGILTVLNEGNEIISWRFCQTRTNAEIAELLLGLKHRHDVLGLPQPKMMVADNCCHIRGAVASAMPETEAKLDVWHFSARYVAAILNASKSPFRSAIAADISGAILKMHAEHGRPAEYWDRGEQEQRLLAAFEKWAEKGVWSAAAQKVHQEQLKHVRKGCLERSDQHLRSDGSRVEGTHKGWNSLQRAQPSGIVMLTALGHDFVLRRNIRVAFSRRQMTPFVEFTHGSHHIQLSNHVAKLYNRLREKGTQLLPLLPELPDVDSGETFGLVASDNATTFGGLLIKEETLDAELAHNFEVHTDSFTGGTVDFATEASRSIMIEDWQIDPALLDQPAAQLPRTMTASNTNTLPAEVAPPSLIKRKAICISPNSDDKSNGGSATTKRPRTLGPASTKTLDGYFASGRLLTWHGEPPSTAAGEVTSPFSPPTNDTHPKAASAQAGNNNPPITPDQRYTGINEAGQTRSQRLFSIATGIDPRSLTFQNSDEFYLFMNMRAEFKWLSYQMTSKRWVLATEEYNHRLVETMGQSIIQKNPQALLRALGDIEPKLMNRIIKDEYTSKRNNETFWRHHCSVVPLVKEERGKKPRKAQTCSRCQTIMYPGPENSPLNHKRGYCADGVKQVLKSGEDLPPWPQPQGLFSEGRTFHPHAFLLAVQRVYERVFMQGPGEMDLLETEAFAKLLASRTEIREDGAVLFQLFTNFVVDPSTPRERIVTHNDKQWLRINFLQQQQL
ncbi:uncharacterized protein F5147DRAFT_782255 [Suillus discolor]|uniref:Uncharacterized protein n=1 Tax=Suillus discolor TaxID=1912936 RepID=A0A9P7ES89_9AGAM|nr:uncharacterized protein F5147DRAFT_782255 [Suillus discolor]KAG2085011.1 hypothetical protein F5147DRAFT_782255 [Suillus discolor]